MDIEALPNLLATAWLLPLASFVLILFFGKRMGRHGEGAGKVATAAIVTSSVLSFVALFGVWLPNRKLPEPHHASTLAESAPVQLASTPADDPGQSPFRLAAETHGAGEHDDHAHGKPNPAPPYETGVFYNLATFGKLKLDVSYYIDSLTVSMFCVVTLIASCVHFYAIGYMHDELHEDYVDHEVTLASGGHLHRKGRFYRFFQYLSLFCFSMLGIVIAGNVAMVFVFWELVGICSYFLIGFYIERQSACNAANKAFIVNRIGDFGMLIGMMALWSSLGTFAFGDAKNTEGEVVEQGIFSLVRSEDNKYALEPTESMEAEGRRIVGPGTDEKPSKAGHWLLLIAGVGIFCGCVGKSAQFPLHVWLPDAMEGPTPVSALVHSATMVAAGVYLVGRFYPVFSSEALLVIAVVGCITLFIAATIAITATDIKRVLAYSTVSQLGYMMLALGIGGWSAGMFHLITHAFFKSLLFLCSGSVIHAVHTNDMTFMGGLRKKMPVTAFTMLVGCLAIIGAGVPTTAFGLSGYYSKDAIIEQAWSFAGANRSHPLLSILLFAPAAGAAITAFYMFRLWYMTFAGKPRDHHRYDHAHESPRVMTMPLVVLAVFAIGVGWAVPGTNLSVTSLLEQAQPIGTAAGGSGELFAALDVPAEALSHTREIKFKAGMLAFSAAALGVLGATILYLWRLLNPAEIRDSFKPLYKFLWNKWWFDELYDAIFVKPVMLVSNLAAKFDRSAIDGLIHGTAATAKGASKIVGHVFDQTVVDGTANAIANRTWDIGLLLKRLQTGKVRQYVLFIVMGTWLLYLAVSFLIVARGGAASTPVPSAEVRNASTVISHHAR
ncbi:MAG: NADH-quinone oxidoreductase subunit L [Pirellulales bacterium]|nr:NADH-quinone oxidoreductase subunit L [Pirellulales bacterium]